MKKSAPKSAAKPAAAKPAAKSAPKAKAPAKKATVPAKKKAAAAVEPPATFISAQIDIGFGNHLTLRGSGPGLSWDKGVPMDNVGHSLWTASITGAVRPVIFKVLVNDLTWNSGDDYTVEPGQSVTVYPTF